MWLAWLIQGLVRFAKTLSWHPVLRILLHFQFELKLVLPMGEYDVLYTHFGLTWLDSNRAIRFGDHNHACAPLCRSCDF